MWLCNSRTDNLRIMFDKCLFVRKAVAIKISPRNAFNDKCVTCIVESFGNFKFMLIFCLVFSKCKIFQSQMQIATSLSYFMHLTQKLTFILFYCSNFVSHSNKVNKELDCFWPFLTSDLLYDQRQCSVIFNRQILTCPLSYLHCNNAAWIIKYMAMRQIKQQSISNKLYDTIIC